MKTGFIYKIICDIPEDHVVYVGKTTQTLGGRLSHHAAIQKHNPTRINKLIRTLGKEHFRIEEIERSTDPEVLKDREIFWTVKLDCIDNGCNVRLGTLMLDESRQQLSETCYKNRSVVCVETGKEFISAVAAASECGVNSSDVTCCCNKKIRQSKGLHFRFADIAESEYTEYWKSGIQRNVRVYCEETDTVYRNAFEASTYLHVSHGHISRACKTTGYLARKKLHVKYV